MPQCEDERHAIKVSPVYAIMISEPGGPEVLQWREVPDPHPGPAEVLIDISASAVNRADLLQRKGFYPPPAGASSILGLECAGVISAVGADVRGLEIGTQVCALLAGGGYAEKVAVPAVQVLSIPIPLTLLESAGLMETACTVWSNLVMTARAAAGEVLLIHGGAGGIGTMAIQIGVALGLTVAVTAGTPAKLAACEALGATILIDYHHDDFVAEIAKVGGADIILDVMGASYLSRNIDALADGGRLMVIGLQGGAKAEIDLNALLRMRRSVTATALRSRPVDGHGSKAEIVAEVGQHLWPLINQGRVRPQIGAHIPLPEAGRAHALLESDSSPGGKIVLVAPDATDLE